MTHVLPPPPLVDLPVMADSARFAVRRIFCVGRNYAAHAAEMGADTREPPFFFTKPADSLVPGGGAMAFPRATTDLHHEAELVVAIGRGGANIPPAAAAAHVWGYAAGIDLTRRDLQAEAKARARPWDMAKGFDQSAPCGALCPAGRAGDLGSARITLRVNGDLRQDAALADMIWPVPDIIAHLSALVTLAPGDLIFTGTPEGVGRIRPGDGLQVRIDGLPSLDVTIG